jgi:hypothetical protein
MRQKPVGEPAATAALNFGTPRLATRALPTLRHPGSHAIRETSKAGSTKRS